MYEDEKQRFKKIQGYELNLENPQSFNEKIVYKKLFDRNPLLVITADKYRARQYIRKKIGWEAENYLIPLYYVTDNPEDIPFDRLPDEYIIKPNNGAGRWILAEGIKGLRTYEVNSTCKKGVNLFRSEIIDICKDWFKTVHGSQWYEWAYQEIKPLIVIEKLLRRNDGKIPNDCRVCIFGGKCKMIYVTTPHQEHFNFYDEDWQLLNFTKPGHEIKKGLEKPKNLSKMIKFAKILSEGFDFIRIDFFLVDDDIYFSEITHYPGSGHGKYPKDFDFELGKYWTIGSGKYDRYK